MPRTKQYIKEEVIDKAMKLFWRNGYENTSMQMLEKEMGINKFSIYSSFGNKRGVFLESLKSYDNITRGITERFISSSNGVEGIKQFFYDSVEICDLKGNQKGCLLTNTYYEFQEVDDDFINNMMKEFMSNLKELFIQKLKIDTTKSEEMILKQANFLLLAKHGLAVASRVNNKKEIKDYIEMTFKNI